MSYIIYIVPNKRPNVPANIERHGKKSPSQSGASGRTLFLLFSPFAPAKVATYVSGGNKKPIEEPHKAPVKAMTYKRSLYVIAVANKCLRHCVARVGFIKKVAAKFHSPTTTQIAQVPIVSAAWRMVPEYNGYFKKLTKIA